jgi:CRISPR-associated protein Cmr3
MSTHLWQFEALDTLFFRESRPMESVGGAQLASRFPPPARTIAGAVRTAIGESSGVDWKRFNAGASEYNELRAAMGDAKHWGTFQLGGPYLMSYGERLFPAPLLLLERECFQETLETSKNELRTNRFGRLSPGATVVNCDLGRVRLPELNPPLAGAKTVEDVWLTAAGLTRVLQGAMPDSSQVKRKNDLFDEEERLGIARDLDRHANVEGALYQTRHIRPRAGLLLAVEIEGIEAKWHPVGGTIRLGAEGRLAAFTTDAVPPSKPGLSPTPQAGTRVLLMLLTPADFAGDWKPATFTQERHQDADVWHGTIQGVPITIVAAIVGKAVREGGWDLARHRPRELRSLVPAGSCYFCEVQGEAQAVVDALQGCRIGCETELGRGEIAAGYW